MNKQFIQMTRTMYLLLGVLAITACNASSDSQAVVAAKQAIETTMKDPLSVQYRNVKEYSSGTVCGEFNGKNSMGGYVGFEFFRYSSVGLSTGKEAKDLDFLCRNY